MPEDDSATEVLDTKRLMFADWLRAHARGSVNDEATAELADVVEAVTQLGKPGKVTIEVTVEPSGATGQAVVVAAKVKTKKPEAAPEAGLFFVGEHGALHRNDPYHPQMVDQQTARVIPAATDDAPKRVVDGDTGEIRRVEEEGE